jgi:hypothetical protein
LQELYPRPVQMALFALWLLILVAALIRWTGLTMASQGRLIFPGIAAISFWLALGLRSLCPRRWRRPVLGALMAVLLLLATVVPFAFIVPAYAPPAMAEALPGDLQRVQIVYGDRFELVGYRLPQREVLPGADLVVELGWRSLAPMDADYSIFVHLYGPEGDLLGQADTHPGGGLLPTSSWAVGDRYLDRIEVPVRPSAGAPAIGRIVVGLYRYEDMEMLQAADPGGTDLGTSPTVGRFKIAALEPPRFDMLEVANYSLGSRLALVGYDLAAAPEEVTLYWQAKEPVSTDYTVFVHLEDQAGSPVAQADSQPQLGAYPTSFWSVNEVVADYHPFPPDAIAELPAGTYKLVTGLYDLQNGARLPVSRDGIPQGDRIALGEISIP